MTTKKGNAGSGKKSHQQTHSRHGHSSADSKTTTNHNEIRKWAEERGGKPSTVRRTHSDKDPGILRIDFPGYSGEGSLEPISWEDFFRKFEEAELAFLYQETTAEGEKSNFNKLISRH